MYINKRGNFEILWGVCTYSQKSLTCHVSVVQVCELGLTCAANKKGDTWINHVQAIHKWIPTKTPRMQMSTRFWRRLAWWERSLLLLSSKWMLLVTKKMIAVSDATGLVSWKTIPWADIRCWYLKEHLKADLSAFSPQTCGPWKENDRRENGWKKIIQDKKKQ